MGVDLYGLLRKTGGIGFGGECDCGFVDLWIRVYLCRGVGPRLEISGMFTG